MESHENKKDTDTQKQNTTPLNSDSPPTKDDEAKTQSTDKVGKSPNDNSNKIITKIINGVKYVFNYKNANITMAVCTAVLAITAIITNVSTCLQMKSTNKEGAQMINNEIEMRRSSDKAEDKRNEILRASMLQGDSIFQTENRAYISCNAGVIQLAKNRKNTYFFAAELANLGKTPAYNVQVSWILDTVIDNPVFQFYGTSKWTIIQIQNTPSFKFFPFDENIINDINLRKKTLYIHGLIVFDDIFKRHHRTHYTAWYNSTIPNGTSNCMYVGDNSQD